MTLYFILHNIYYHSFVILLSLRPFFINFIYSNMKTAKDKTPFDTAIQLQHNAASQNFEWPHIKDIVDKCREELEELEQAIEAQDQKNIEEELGDLLFALVNIARNTATDPSESLSKANAKFLSRYNGMIDDANSLDKDFSQLSLSEMKTLWQAQKAKTL